MTPKMGLWFIYFVRRNAISRADASPLVVSVTNLIHRPGTMETTPRSCLHRQTWATRSSAWKRVRILTSIFVWSLLLMVSLVTGSVVVDVHGECSLCLDPIDYEMSANIQELFVFEKAPAGGPEDEVDEQYAVEDDSIDLEPALRDAVILQLPFQPVCRGHLPGSVRRLRCAPGG